MFSWFKAWRRRRILRRHSVPDTLWQGVVDRLSFLHGLSQEELTRLRELVVLFLHAKQMSAAGGLTLTDEMRLMIAVQACLPILNLDPDCYADWVEIIIYPDIFVPEHEYTDENGLVHTERMPMSGEAWLGGPVILSWHDVGHAHAADGHNVVIHEFAHKLDMLNGNADGFPPLHAEMSRQEWSTAFSLAYQDFCRRVEAKERTLLDPYAAETPAEFFAVISEAFFEIPKVVRDGYPEVYVQLSRFYRQNPAARC